MRLLFLIAAFVATGLFGSAQESLYQSGNGETAIYLRQSTTAVNLGDSKASVAYIDRTNIHPYSWGVEAYATANTGVASLFASTQPKAPEGGGSGTLVRHYILAKRPVVGAGAGPAKEDWLLVDGGYGRSSFYIYPTNAAPSTSTAKTSFERFRTILAYNYFAGGDRILGFAAGAERRNNLSNLKSTSQQTVVVAGAPGSTSSIVTTQAGYYGNYKVYIAAPIYTDALFYLPGKVMVPGFDNRIGVDLFTRSDLAAVNRGSAGGIGIFLFKKSDPLSSIGGLTASYDGTNFQVSLTAGICFSK
jgi:hypothetical protein